MKSKIKKIKFGVSFALSSLFFMGFIFNLGKKESPLVYAPLEKAYADVPVTGDGGDSGAGGGDCGSDCD